MVTQVTRTIIYRAIILSNSLNKMFTCFLQYISMYDDTDKSHFNFKTGHPTMLYTNAFKNVINYYTIVVVTTLTYFVNCTKTFAQVNYQKLFNMLLDVKVPMNIVLYYQLATDCINKFSVRWQSAESEKNFVAEWYTTRLVFFLRTSSLNTLED